MQGRNTTKLAHPIVWELAEPTDEVPDVGLNWLVRGASSLRHRNGQPNLAAIGRLTGISYSALNAILPARRGQRDFRTPDERTLGRMTLAGALVNGVTPEVAHAMIFRLPIAPEAVADLTERLAELEAASEVRAA